MRSLSHPRTIPPRPEFTAFTSADWWNVPGYRRNLPHLRHEGATYSVTFRLADSIPARVAERWVADRRRWLAEHGIDPGLERADARKFFDALAAIDQRLRREFELQQVRQFFVELDRCHGCCALAEHHATVAEALEHFHGQRLWLGDYVVMPNHVHAIAQPFPGVRLEEWLYSVKRFTAGVIVAIAGAAVTRSSHLWQGESFDRIIRDVSELARARRYIATNPAHVPAGGFALKQMEWLDGFAPRQ